MLVKVVRRRNGLARRVVPREFKLSSLVIRDEGFLLFLWDKSGRYDDMHTIKETIATAVREHANQLLQEAGHSWPHGLQVLVEHPAHDEHGDYATNVAMLLAKSLRRPPLQIAAAIRDSLQASGSIGGLLDTVEAVPPGFINMRLNWHNWAEWSAIQDAEQEGGKGNEATVEDKSALKVVIEHTSINPNKAAHIGHLRNSCIGDTLARLYKRIGYRVEVHNYIDDLGNQLADTVVGLLHTGSHKEHQRFGDFCWDTYATINKAYSANPALTEERTRVLHELEQGHSSTAWLGELVAEKIVREHTAEMRQFGIRYDVLVWESHLVRQGFWAAAFAKLKETAAFTQVEEGKLAGCWVLRQGGGAEGAALESSTGTSQASNEASSGKHSTEGTAASEAASDTDHQADKVLVRSNGILTYTAKDIAYHLWKFGLLDQSFTYTRFATDGLWTTASVQGVNKRFGRADIVLNVIDHRQQYPQAMVKQALEALGFTRQAERLQHVSYGVVSLSPGTAEELGIDTSDGKASYAMSGRQGIGVKVDDMLGLMEQVIEEKRSRRTGLSSRAIAAAAIRYYLLRYNLHTEVVFDLHKATEITGNTGVYLLYAHARAASIIARAEKEVKGIAAAVTRSTPEFPDPLAPNQGLEPVEYALLRQIAYWPETLEDAAAERAPNLIGTYAHELATAFNTFYAACPILKAEEGRRSFRVWLTAKYKETLGDALQVLGLPTPSRM